MKKPKNATGTLIPLHWEDDPESLYVHGHVDAATFRAAVTDYYDADDPIGYGRFPVLDEESVHHWGRYCFNGSCDGETIRTLFTSPVKSRGAFPCTAASVSWTVHLRCDGYAGEEPCWIRKGHDGPHLPHAEWSVRLDVVRAGRVRS